MLTRGVLAAELTRLVEIATRPLQRPGGVEETMAGWSARDLLAADELFRRGWYGYLDGCRSSLHLPCAEVQTRFVLAA